MDAKLLSVPGYRILSPPKAGKGKYTEIKVEKLAGGLNEGSSVRLYPGNYKLRIKTLKAGEGGDVLTIKGVPRARIKVGMVLCPSEWPIVEAREALFLSDGQPPPGTGEQVRGGLCADFNKERLVGRASLQRDGPYVSFHFPSPYPLLPGTQCSIIDRDGKPRRFTLLWPGRPSLIERKRLDSIARRRPQAHPEPKEIYSRLLHLRGFVALPPPLLQLAWPEAVLSGGWAILEPVCVKLDKLLLKAASRPGGVEAATLSLTDYPGELCRARADTLVANGALIERRAWYFPPGDPPLSPFHRSMLATVESKSEEGLRILTLKDSARREAMEALGRSGLLHGGKELWLSSEAYASLSERLLENLAPGMPVPISLARERLGGSRPLLIELLQALENDGRLSPDSDGEGRRFIS